MKHKAVTTFVAVLAAASSLTVLADDKAKKEFVHEANVMSRSSTDDADASATGDNNKQNVGPVRWMAPESIDRKPSSSAPPAQPARQLDSDASQPRKTDKDKAARSATSAPCPVESTAKTDAETAPPGPAPETGKTQGCN